MNYLAGKLITSIVPRHRHQEWLALLKKIDRETPKDLALHQIAENYATPEHAECKAWRAKHPRLEIALEGPDFAVFSSEVVNLSL